MKPIALAVLAPVLAAVLLSACAQGDLEKRAAAERQVSERAHAATANAAAAEAAAAAATAAAAAAAAAEKAAAAASTTGDLELPAPATPTEQHAWLQQLVGDWTFTCTTSMDAAFSLKGTESVRSVGKLWIVSEGRATLAGQPVQSLMSLGYDPQAQAFVGTWFDSSQTHLWTYRGTLDAGGTKLLLDTEGPSFEDPGTTSRYRDSIEIKDPDHKLLSSAVQNSDGSWTTFMQSEFVRRKR